jgi:hypothetical protein
MLKPTVLYEKAARILRTLLLSGVGAAHCFIPESMLPTLHRLCPV